MVSTCSSVKDTYCVVFSFDIISATISADILSAMYFLSLLLTGSDISRFFSLFTVNIADTCVAVTAHGVYLFIGERYLLCCLFF